MERPAADGRKYDQTSAGSHVCRTTVSAQCDISCFRSWR